MSQKLPTGPTMKSVEEMLSELQQMNLNLEIVCYENIGWKARYGNDIVGYKMETLPGDIRQVVASLYRYGMEKRETAK